MLVEDIHRQHQVTVVSHSLEEVAASGITWQPVPMVAKPATARYLSFIAANALTLRAAAARFEIVHSCGPDSIHANVATAQFCQAERFRMLRSKEIELPKKTEGQRLRFAEAFVFGTITSFAERRIYRGHKMKAVIAVSRGVERELLRHYGLHPERVCVIPNAVDGDVFSPRNRCQFRSAIRSRYGLMDRDVVLLFAGHDWERKGLDLVLEAVARLPFRSRDRSKLLVVGRGNRGYYRAMAAKLGVEEMVAFVGEVADMRAYYATADLLVFPSRYEAFSLVTLEAAASGIPLVTSRINGTEELVEDGINGFFVRHDPEELATRLELLIEDERLRAEMGEAAEASARRYSREDVARKTLDVYERVVAS